MLGLQIPANEMRVCARGEVVRGDQRGRLLGFPTANIAVDEEGFLVPDGVYAGYLHRDNGSCHAAAISLGRRTTFYDADGLRLLEAHLLDFAGDIYGEVVTVEIAARLRGQVRFAGPEALCAQLEIDVSRCRDVLTRCAPSGRESAPTSAWADDHILPNTYSTNR